MAGKSKPNKKKTGKKTMKNNGKNFDNTTAKTEESRDKGYEKLKVEYETVVVERNFLRDKLVTTTAELEVVKKELANLKSQSILPAKAPSKKSQGGKCFEAKLAMPKPPPASLEDSRKKVVDLMSQIANGINHWKKQGVMLSGNFFVSPLQLVAPGTQALYMSTDSMFTVGSGVGRLGDNGKLKIGLVEEDHPLRIALSRAQYEAAKNPKSIVLNMHGYSDSREMTIHILDMWALLHIVCSKKTEYSFLVNLQLLTDEIGVGLRIDGGQINVDDPLTRKAMERTLTSRTAYCSLPVEKEMTFTVTGRPEEIALCLSGKHLETSVKTARSLSDFLL